LLHSCSLCPNTALLLYSIPLIPYINRVKKYPVCGECDVLLLQGFPHDPQVERGIVGDKEDDLVLIRSHVSQPLLKKLKRSTEIWLVFQHPLRDPVDLVGHEVYGMFALDEGGKDPASDKALDGHLDRLCVPEIVALKVNQNRSNRLAILKLTGWREVGFGRLTWRKEISKLR